MNLSKLYKALVVGGTALTMGCATTGDTTSGIPAEVEPTLASCKEICSAMTGGEVFCPDPVQKTDNCCWLMGSQEHPCCVHEAKDFLAP